MGDVVPAESRIFDLITARLPALVAYVDRQLNYRFCNQAYEVFFGVAPGALDGCPVVEALGGVVYARARDEIERVLAGQRVQFDVTLPAAADRERTLQVEYLPDFESGSREVRGYVIVAHDITIRKKAERELIERTASFQLLTETIPSGIWRCDPDGAADYASQRFADMVGFKVEDLLGWGWSSLIHPEDQPRVLREWQTARAAGGAIVIEFRVRHARGDYQWFISQGNPFRDETGQIIKYYGTWTNVDEQKRTAVENVELLHRERTAVRVRDEFLSAASHELKTPLTALKLQSQLLRHRREKGDAAAYSPERIDTLIEQVDLQVNRMTRLVDDMLDISRIQTGRLHMHSGLVDVGYWLESSVRLSREHLSADHGATLQLTAPEPALVRGDVQRLTQVLTSLLANAVRFGDGRPVRVGATTADGFVTVSVRDEGRGLAADKREKIFERFENAVGPNEGSGLGLGLFIARQIVTSHEGQIWVESEPGRGATFFVRLPVAVD